MILTALIDIDKLFLLILVIVLSIIYLRRQSVTQFPGGPLGFPLIGNYGILQNRPHIRLTQLQRSFGDVFSITVGRKKMVVVSSWEGIMEGLVKKSVSMSGRPQNLMKNMFNSGTCKAGKSDLLSLTDVKKIPIYVHVLCCFGQMKGSSILLI